MTFRPVPEEDLLPRRRQRNERRGFTDAMPLEGRPATSTREGQIGLLCGLAVLVCLPAVPFRMFLASPPAALARHNGVWFKHVSCVSDLRRSGQETGCSVEGPVREGQ